MKLLIITNNPERSSFRQRVGVYLDILREQGVECEVAKLPQKTFSRWALFRKSAEYDGVLLQKKPLNFMDAKVLRKYSRRVIYNYDDAIMFKEKQSETHCRSRFMPFQRTASMADLIVVGSKYLAEQAKPFNSRVTILPIGLDVGSYRVPVVRKDPDEVRLVWIGSEATIGYMENLRPLLEEIGAKYKNVILRIICDNFIDLQNMPVEKYKWEKDKRGQYLSECDIGLAPLPADNFSRGKCSFKVLEYSAAGLPVVADPVGTNGEYVINDVTGRLVGTLAEWNAAVGELIDKPELRAQMGRKGLENAQNYDISVIGPQFAEIIKEACIPVS